MIISFTNEHLAALTFVVILQNIGFTRRVRIAIKYAKHALVAKGPNKISRYSEGSVAIAHSQNTKKQLNKNISGPYRRSQTAYIKFKQHYQMTYQQHRLAPLSRLVYSLLRQALWELFDVNI